MTDEQINEAIAEAHGWTEIQDSGVWHHHKLWGYLPLKPGQGEKLFDYLPNYCTDLNAMHEAEKVLTDDEYCGFTDCLYDLERHRQNQTKKWRWLSATARQRAEAFLRTLGKWKEATDKESLTVGGATTEECSADQKEVQK